MPERNPALEALLLERCCAVARRRFGVATAGFADRVAHRLELGAGRYGDAAFLDPGRDNLAEAIEETADQAAYMLLELQRLDRPGPVPPDVRDDLLRVVLFAATADAYCRRARARRRTGDS